MTPHAGCHEHLRPARRPLRKTSLGIMKAPYPEIQGGGSLILAWQIRNKRVLVVGGGEVSLLTAVSLQSIDD